MNWSNFYSFSLFLYLVAVSTKGGDGIFVDVNPIISSFQAYNLHIYVVAIFGMSIVAYKYSNRAKKISVSLPVFFYILFNIIYCLRLLIDDGDPVKLFISLYGNIIIILAIGAGRNISNYSEDWHQGNKNFVLAWAWFYSMVVLFNYITGYGYNSGTPRYYGISDHPNFAGVALAVAAIYVWACIWDLSYRIPIRFISCLMFATASFLCFKTASRTGIVIFVTGILSLFYFSSGRLKSYSDNKFAQIALIIFAGLLFSIYVSDLDILERLQDTGDNRSDVWELMVKVFFDNFYFGAGHQIGGSESSILKALAGSGVVGGVFFCAFFLVGLYELMNYKNHKESSVWRAIIFALFIASFVEGYLVELAGPWTFLCVVSFELIRYSRHD